MSIANTEQAEIWNTGDGVAHWVRHHAQYERMLSPFADLLLGAAALRPGQDVLDVGCGFGVTTLAAARQVAPGSVLGADLSAPLLSLARERAAASGLGNVSFEQGDVQVHPFGPSRFDTVISRFGVMFFEDPVAAFANIRSAVRPGGRLVFASWQPLIANEWMLVPESALAGHVPHSDLGTVPGPGMFGLADEDRVRQILSSAGWQDIALTPHQVPVLAGGGGSIDDTVSFLRTATIGRTMLEGADPSTVEQALASLRAALVPHAGADGVHLGAGVWVVQAAA